MRRSWFAILSTVSCLALGVSTLQAQTSRCDSASLRCSGSCQCNQRVGVTIPSLQFLVVDRLSAAGDRLEHALRGASCRTHSPKRTKSCSCAEPACGVDSTSVAQPVCDSSHIFMSDRESSRNTNKYPGISSDSRQGSISDIVPEAPLNPVPIVPPSSDLTRNSDPIRNSDLTRNDDLAQNDDLAPQAAEPSVPKLLPTPVSEQVAAPKFPDLPEALSDVSDGVAIPDIPPLPSAEEATVPTPPQQPLPDILVDPFIEDVGQTKTRSGTAVALASSVEALPINALREGEPKRLSLSQKGIIAKELMAPKSTRIIFKRYFDEKLEP